MILFTILLLAAATLPTGWKVEPAGRKVDLDTFPVYAKLLRDGQHTIVLQSGFRPPSLAMLNVKSGAVVASLTLPDSGFNFALDSDSGTVYVPLGHKAAYAVVKIQDGVRFELLKSVEAKTGYVSTLSLQGRLLALVHPHHDTVAIVDVATGDAVRNLSIANPVRAIFGSGVLYVLGAAGLQAFGLETFEPGAIISASPGSLDIALAGGKLYVAASLSNHLDVFSLSGSALAPKPLERIYLAPAPGWPAGVSPTALSVDTFAKRIYVVCSDMNAVAVYDLESNLVSGYVPTGWYPAYALPLPDRGLLVLNGKGEQSYPNPRGPNPTVHATMTPQPPSQIQYTPLIQTGTGRIVEQIDQRKLKELSRTFASITPRPSVERDRVKELPPIRHVIYIMKENRTYDQVLGDLPKGNGDPSLCLFPERITPNHHKLAREFVLFDNFFVNADVSSEGWYWSSAAIVPPAVMRSWPAAYAGRTRPVPQRKASTPGTPSGFLWTAALKAGLTVRNYGFFVNNRPGGKPGEPIVASISDPELAPHTNPLFAGYDPGFPDVERARIFIEELRRTGRLAALTVMVLPNDHTWGTAPGKLTPNASMADNDLALGQIVEAVSKSRFWPHTAIFVLEDDAQNGPDHVDSHRSPAYVISPYTRRGGMVDSNFYNTTSMLRTMEALLKLPHLTPYDASSPLMIRPFAAKPDLRPYVAEAARVPLDTLNPARSATAARSAALDLSVPDRVDEAEMNSILWLALREKQPMPPATRAAFRRTNAPATPKAQVNPASEP